MLAAAARVLAHARASRPLLSEQGARVPRGQRCSCAAGGPRGQRCCSSAAHHVCKPKVQVAQRERPAAPGDGSGAACRRRRVAPAARKLLPPHPARSSAASPLQLLGVQPPRAVHVYGLKPVAVAAEAGLAAPPAARCVAAAAAVAASSQAQAEHAPGGQLRVHAACSLLRAASAWRRLGQADGLMAGE